MAAASRRGFLRDLVSLPLIGGGLTIIGAPTAVAEPASFELLREYETWLGYEQIRTARLIRPGTNMVGTALYGPAHDWHYERGRREWLQDGPESRAALVLSTVGCDWRKEGGLCA